MNTENANTAMLLLNLIKLQIHASLKIVFKQILQVVYCAKIPSSFLMEAAPCSIVTMSRTVNVFSANPDIISRKEFFARLIV
jgi:hypothetical protein